jgi:1-acyl-sn-glycerol-3-phosphate acyltransferase
MKLIRAPWRVLRVVTHMLFGAFTILVRFPALTPNQRQACVQVWSARLLDCFGIRLEVSGARHVSGPLMVVANHVSWLDISTLHAVQFSRFVAKADLRHWLLIGMMAGRAGTLFIERESRRDAMRVVHHMADSLRNGDILTVFPEGTTSDGTQLLPFHANLFQAAISANAPVQAVFIEYIDAASGRRHTAPNFVGNEFFLVSVWRTLCASGLTARVRMSEPQAIDGRDRRTLAAQMQAAVAALKPRA